MALGFYLASAAGRWSSPPTRIGTSGVSRPAAIEVPSPWAAYQLVSSFFEYRYLYQSHYRRWVSHCHREGPNSIGWVEWLERNGLGNMLHQGCFMDSSLWDQCRFIHGSCPTDYMISGLEHFPRGQSIGVNLDDGLTNFGQMTINNLSALIRGELRHGERGIGGFPPAANHFLENKLCAEGMVRDHLHDLANTVHGPRDDAREFVRDIVNRLGCVWMFNELAIVCQEPTFIHTDPQGRIHSTEGLAVRWPDGYGIAACNGILIEAWKLLEPERLSLQEILNEPNMQARRALIERRGAEAFVEAGLAQRGRTDSYGTVYIIPMITDEPVVIVKVTNKTAEPDGTFRDYYLRVPPHFRHRSPQEAIAWTFNTSEYGPVAET